MRGGSSGNVNIKAIDVLSDYALIVMGEFEDFLAAYGNRCYIVGWWIAAIFPLLQLPAKNFISTFSRSTGRIPFRPLRLAVSGIPARKILP